MHKCLTHNGSKSIPFKRLACSSFSLTTNTIAEMKYTRILILWRSSSRNQLCHCNVPPNHSPMCSLISQQHCHPWDGHDFPRKRKLAGSHIAKDMSKHSQAKAMLGFIRLLRGWKGLFAKIVSSTIEPWTPTQDLTGLFQHVHTQHKESSPSLVYSPSGYAFPSNGI